VPPFSCRDPRDPLLWSRIYPLQYLSNDASLDCAAKQCRSHDYLLPKHPLLQYISAYLLSLPYVISRFAEPEPIQDQESTCILSTQSSSRSMWASQPAMLTVARIACPKVLLTPRRLRFRRTVLITKCPRLRHRVPIMYAPEQFRVIIISDKRPTFFGVFVYIIDGLSVSTLDKRFRILEISVD
jgi:hypothetical protein